MQLWQALTQCRRLLRGVDAALESLAGKDHIIVHCALSQQRGPKCARRCAVRASMTVGAGSEIDAAMQDQQRVVCWH